MRTPIRSKFLGKKLYYLARSENDSSMVVKVRANHRPLIITQSGNSPAALVLTESYQEMLDRIQILTDIAESEEEIARGGGIEQEVLRKELMAKYKA